MSTDKPFTKENLMSFQAEYPGVLQEDNLADILKAAKAKKKNK